MRKIVWIAILLLGGCSTGTPHARGRSGVVAFCKPGQPCWPTPLEWRELAARLEGGLEVPKSPLLACGADSGRAECLAALKMMKNPFYIEDQPGLTQSTGWLGAWKTAPSPYAVVAKSEKDVVAAVRFARRHRLRLVIKGTGHDYLGRSNAPDSLLVWTHQMREVTVRDAFVPQGCANRTPVPAVSVAAGARWLDVYRVVTGEHHRYVQGGGCTSVGAAGGFLQGGGFGSWSKRYGIAAASLLEARVVTADGRVLTANDCRNQDLLWALRGGGGGTFGIVTQVTLGTYRLPKTFGWVSGRIAAKSDAGFRDLIREFVRFYGEKLNNEHWGEQVQVRRDDSLRLGLVFEGMSKGQAKRVWSPFIRWLRDRGADLSVKIRFATIPAERMWDFGYFKRTAPGAVVSGSGSGSGPGASAALFWWTGDKDQVSAYWYSYQSRWLPARLFHGNAVDSFAKTLYDASRYADVGLHFNKGQADAAAEALRRDRATSMNPVVLDSAALAIMGAYTNAYPGIPGHEPDRGQGEREKARIDAAMKILREATPNSGAYVNEADYFEPDWRRALWGGNYPRLLEIKKKYDPDGMFRCHHCVGDPQ